MDILFKQESYQIIGACMKVHRTLGAGFLEKVYQEALEHEMRKLSIPYEREKQLQIFYNEVKLDKYYKADFLCFDSIILEIKAQKFISENDKKQVLNYLKSTSLKLGLLVNFGTPSLTYKRIIN